MDKSFVLFLWIFAHYPALKGGSLPEGSAARTTVCASNPLRGSCPTNELIAVLDVTYGTKLSSTCGLPDNSSGCCDYDANDCFRPDYSDTAQQRACSGRDLCYDVSVNKADTSSCGSPYPILNHYLSMEYYCIQGSRTLSMCAVNSNSSTGSLLYIMNQDYPSAIRSADTSCSCSIEAASCSSRIKVYLIHFQLWDGGGSCSGIQQVEILDNENNQTLTCFNNTYYEITLETTSTSNYITLTLRNSGGTNDGYFWIGFEGTDGSARLSVDCPAAVRTMCMDCPALTAPNNGSLSTTAVSTGTIVTLTCNSDYTLKGYKSLLCQDNGTWDKEVGICTPNCPALIPPNNGSLSTTAMTTGTTVIVTCNSGYTLNGDTSLLCQGDGTWDKAVGACRPVMSNNCSEEDDCSAVLTGSTCVSNRCVCEDGYKEQNSVCVDTKDNKGSLPPGYLAGILVGCIVGTLIISALVGFLANKMYLRRGKNKDKSHLVPNTVSPLPEKNLQKQTYIERDRK